MFYVYVLRSDKDGALYIGSTNDLRRRLQEHNSGKVESTHSRFPFQLVYYEAYAAQQDARKRESQLKRFSGAYTHLKRRIVNSLILFK